MMDQDSIIDHSAQTSKEQRSASFSAGNIATAMSSAEKTNISLLSRGLAKKSKFLSLDRRNSGETLIEVILSMVILSVVLLGSYLLTNRATQITQAANEKTQASNIVRSQAEILKAWSEADRAVTPGIDRSDTSQLWDNKLVGTAVVGSMEPQIACDFAGPSGSLRVRPTTGASSFVFDEAGKHHAIPVGMDVEKYTELNGPSGAELPYYVWVEPIQQTIGDTYIDFHIFACWERLGGGQVDRTGVVVRMNL